jgi:twinkle protein
MYEGLRIREIVTFVAGTGVGKSLICREIATSLIQRGEGVGYIALEESVKKSVEGLMSVYLNVPLHKKGRKAEVLATRPDEFRAAWEDLNGKAYFFDHWGSADSETLMNKIRYLAHACSCRWIVLDHLSIVVSGQEEGDERRLIDNIMTKLRGLVEELNIGMLLVSHLKRPEGKGHENGAETALSQLRGSAAIAQLSDGVIGSERDQQDKLYGHITTIRGLKNRYAGGVGIAGYLSYDSATGRLNELSDCPFDIEEEPDGQANTKADQ